MPKLTDTQATILTRAATRPGNVAMPLPEGLAGAAAKMAVTKMIERGWLEEVEANPRRNEPLWRETGDGHGTTLVATEAGLGVIGVDPVVASTVTNLRQARLNLTSASKEPAKTSPAAGTPDPIAIRAGTKQAQIIALLQRAGGASIGEIVEATGWAPHSARGMISGGLKKRLGFDIATTSDAQRGRIYHIRGST